MSATFYENRARDAIHEAVERAIDANLSAESFTRIAAGAWEDVCRERGKRESERLMAYVSKV